MSDKIVLAIDPDKQGAMVLLREKTILKCVVMPLVQSTKAKDLYDLDAIKQFFLNCIRENAPSIIAIEKQSPFPNVFVGADEKPCLTCGRIGKSTGSLANYNRGYAAVFEMLCVAIGLRYALIAPQTWQAEMLRDVSHAKDTKQAALVVAKRLWPNRTWLATERSRKPHKGLIDAALIGAFAIRRGL